MASTHRPACPALVPRRTNAVVALAACAIAVAVASGCTRPCPKPGAWPRLAPGNPVTDYSVVEGIAGPLSWNWKWFASCDLVEARTREVRGQVKWVRIPAGTFTMGCTGAQGDACEQDERPTRVIRVPRPFEMMATELTQAEFLTFWIRQHPSEIYAASRESVRSWLRLSEAAEEAFAQGRYDAGLDQVVRDARPMIGMSWADADDVCRALGGRLPTEAEWEYAARGGLSGGTYPWGGEPPTCERAWFGNCSPEKPGLRPTAQGVPNAFGLYDMAGNASEWVADWYWESAYSKFPTGEPAGPDRHWDPLSVVLPFGLGIFKTVNSHVVRGGGFASAAADLRVANRAAGPWVESDRNSRGTMPSTDIGCRCVRDVR